MMSRGRSDSTVGADLTARGPPQPRSGAFMAWRSAGNLLGLKRASQAARIDPERIPPRTGPWDHRAALAVHAPRRRGNEQFVVVAGPGTSIEDRGAPPRPSPSSAATGAADEPPRSLARDLRAPPKPMFAGVR